MNNPKITLIDGPSGHPETLERTTATLHWIKAATARHLTEATETSQNKVPMM